MASVQRGRDLIPIKSKREVKIEGKDWVDAYLDHGIDIQNRRVWLVGDVEEDSILNAIKGLYLMDTISDEPCELFISTYGGDMTEAHALYDIIHTLGCAVHTFAFGKCMSAGPLLFACGDKGHRWVAPHAEFMMHDYTSTISGLAATLKIELDYAEKINKERLRLLAHHSNKTYQFWRGLCNRKTDVYFSADDAIDWGIADQVWVERGDAHDA